MVHGRNLSATVQRAISIINFANMVSWDSYYEFVFKIIITCNSCISHLT